MEDKFTAAGQVQRPDTLSSIFQNMFAPPNENLQELNAQGLRILEVTKKLGQHLHLGPLEMRDGLSHTSLYGTRYQKYCPRIPKCQKQKYRTFDGSCNNLKHQLWGKSITQFNRILPASYSDGICEFRNSVRGTPLPLPRVITNEVVGFRLLPSLFILNFSYLAY